MLLFFSRPKKNPVLLNRVLRNLCLHSLISLERIFKENQLHVKERSYIPAGMWYSLPNQHTYICLLFATNPKIKFLSTEAEKLTD